MRVYHADIAEIAARDGTFTATLRGSPITATGPDPEHDLCFAIVSAGLPDGSIQFWRGSTPSLLFHSVHRAARYRIGLGGDYPYRLARRKEGSPETRSKARTRLTQNRETPLAGTSGHPTLPPVPESPRTVYEVAL